MRRVRHPLRQLAPLLVLGLTACGHSSSDLTITEAGQQCAAVTAATRQVILVNPSTATPDQVERIRTAGEQLTRAADAASTDVAAPARTMAATVGDYATALARRDAERATITEGLLRQQAVPIAAQCGTTADLVLGSTSGAASQTS